METKTMIINMETAPVTSINAYFPRANTKLHMIEQLSQHNLEDPNVNKRNKTSSIG